MLSRILDDLFKSLDIDKGEWLEILSVEKVHQLHFWLV